MSLLRAFVLTRVLGGLLGCGGVVPGTAGRPKVLLIATVSLDTEDDTAGTVATLECAQEVGEISFSPSPSAVQQSQHFCLAFAEP